MRASLASSLSGFEWTSMFRALRHRNYRLFIGGQFISLIGTWMQNVAQSWLIYRLTGSSFLLGLIGFVGLLPNFLLAPAGGAVADRVDRRRVVIATQFAMMLLAFLLASLTLGGWVRLWHVFVLAGLMGITNAFDVPARQAFFVQMVGKDDLTSAIALNSSVFNSARVVGPAIAGLLVAVVGEGWCFLINAISYIAVIASLFQLRLASRPARRPPGASPFADVVEGFRYVRHTGPVHALLMLLGIASLVGMPYTVLMPVFADQILQGGARSLGLLLGASGAGAVAGALTVAARRGIRGLGRLVAFSCALFGLFLVLFAMSRSFWLSMLLLFPVGFCVMVQMACSNTLIQTVVPDALRGRVMSLYSMSFLGISPFGALLAGAAAERFGAPLTVGTGGVICLVSAVFFRRYWRFLRVQVRELIVAQEVAAGDPPEGVTNVRLDKDNSTEHP
ncbi:MAG: MFS transporter [Bryobacteraceae bacterium]